MIAVALGYLAIGAAAGVLAGLLGVGGGLIIVPLLAASFARQGLPADSLMHLALGTSLASIVFTSISSFRAHHRRGAVDWGIVRRITPGILAGTFGGSWVAARLSTRPLTWVFTVFLFSVSIQMFLDRKPRPTREIPCAAGTSAVGALIGVISSLVGIGGGSLSVPFMAWCNVPVHRAIGTSAAIGFPIAVAGAAGYVLNGLRAQGLPPHTLGFVHLPALAGVVAASVATAPLGARLAHSLPVPRLKRAFAALLLVMGVKMLVGLLGR
ncbi:MAG TPA: sulfite exporter TauE/SafE family protein [bacterium]